MLNCVWANWPLQLWAHGSVGKTNRWGLWQCIDEPDESWCRGCGLAAGAIDSYPPHTQHLELSYCNEWELLFPTSLTVSLPLINSPLFPIKVWTVVQMRLRRGLERSCVCVNEHSPVASTFFNKLEKQRQVPTFHGQRVLVSFFLHVVDQSKQSTNPGSTVAAQKGILQLKYCHSDTEPRFQHNWRIVIKSFQNIPVAVMRVFMSEELSVTCCLI